MEQNQTEKQPVRIKHPTLKNPNTDEPNPDRNTKLQLFLLWVPRFSSTVSPAVSGVVVARLLSFHGAFLLVVLLTDRRAATGRHTVRWFLQISDLLFGCKKVLSFILAPDSPTDVRTPLSCRTDKIIRCGPVQNLKLWHLDLLGSAIREYNYPDCASLCPSSFTFMLHIPSQNG